MKVCIIYRKEKFADETVVKNIASEFEKRGADVSLASTYPSGSEADVLFVLGGDGMVLHTAMAACGTDAKIIGVNYGHLGFLTEYEGSETLRAIDLVCSGDYNVLRRSVLELKSGDKTAYALNEVSVNRDPMAKGVKQMVDFSVRVDGLGEERFIADGVIACTPTGSTAYSLSAGGCILSPEAPVLMITPVCSFSLWSRPIVYSDEKTLYVTVTRQTDKCMCFADGKPFAYLSFGDMLAVKKAPFTANFIVAKKHSFFERLTKKISD